MPDPPEAPPSASDPLHDIPYAAELKRKGLHLLALVVPLGMALLGRTRSLYLLIPAALVALSADVLRSRSRRFNGLILRIFGFMMRTDELPPVGGAVSVNGATWVLLSAALLALLFPLPIAVPAFVMFMVSDAAAALVGRRYGRHHWGKGPRTVEGSAAFFVTGFLVMGLFPRFPLWVGAVSVLFACAAEALPRPLNDNLRVPLVAAAVLYGLERYALGVEVSLW